MDPELKAYLGDMRAFMEAQFAAIRGTLDGHDRKFLEHDRKFA